MLAVMQKCFFLIICALLIFACVRSQRNAPITDADQQVVDNKDGNNSSDEGEEYVYAQYYLVHRPNMQVGEPEIIVVAAKIKMQDDIPTHLYLRHLDVLSRDKKTAIESFEYSMKLNKKESGDSVSYEGESGDEIYTLVYNKAEKRYDLTVDNGETYTIASHKTIAANTYIDYKVTTYSGKDLSVEEKEAFKTNCLDLAGLSEHDNPVAPLLYDRQHEISGKNVLRFSGQGKCPLNIYGLSDPDVVNYLLRCGAKCISSTQHRNDTDESDNKVFRLQFANPKINLWAECRDTSAAFYMGKGHKFNRLYIVSHASASDETTAHWQDCQSGEHGDAYTGLDDLNFPQGEYKYRSQLSKRISLMCKNLLDSSSCFTEFCLPQTS